MAIALPLLMTSNSASAQEIPVVAGPQLPAAVVALAKTDVKQMAQALLGVGISVGLVRGPPAVRPSTSAVAAPLPLEPRVALADVRTAFLSSHPSAKWRVEADVLVVEMSRRGRCHDALATNVEAFTYDGPAYFAVHDLTRVASGELGKGIPPAIVGGPPEAGEAVTLSRTTVRVRVESGAVSDLLFAISRQVPGLGWAARETVGPAANGSWPPGPRCVIDLFTSRVWLPAGFELHPPEQERK